MDFDFTLETITPDASTLLTTGGTGAFQLPSGTTAQEPAGAIAGALRWNTSVPQLEYYTGSVWSPIANNVGTVVTFSAGSTGFTPSSATTGIITLAGILNLASGGTNANLTAVNGGVVYSTGSAFAISAVGIANQVLTSNGAAAPTWSSTSPGSYSVLLLDTNWGALGGTYTGVYTQIVTHNLGTFNIEVQTWNATTNQMISSDSIIATSTNTITVSVATIPTYSIRVIVIANGLALAAGGSTPSSVIVQNQGIAVSGSPFTIVNLAAGLVGTNTGTGTVTITPSSGSIIKSFTYYATSLDSPNNADWVINSLAPTVNDPTNGAITVRQFINTSETGIGFMNTIPVGASNITVAIKGRSATAPTSPNVNVVHNLYYRGIPNNAAITSWSTASALTTISVPTTGTYYQYFIQTIALATLSLTAGELYQFELTRSSSNTNILPYNWYVSEITITYT